VSVKYLKPAIVLSDTALGLKYESDIIRTKKLINRLTDGWKGNDAYRQSANENRRWPISATRATLSVRQHCWRKPRRCECSLFSRLAQVSIKRQHKKYIKLKIGGNTLFLSSYRLDGYWAPSLHQFSSGISPFVPATGSCPDPVPIWPALGIGFASCYTCTFSTHIVICVGHRCKELIIVLNIRPNYITNSYTT